MSVNKWKVGDTAFIKGVDGKVFPEPVKVSLLSFCPAESDSVRVGDRYGNTWKCYRSDLYQRKSQAQKSEESLCVSESVEKQAKCLAEERMKNLMAESVKRADIEKTLPSFEEVYDDFAAIISLDKEKSVVGDRTRVVELAKSALIEKIKNGVRKG